MEQGTLWGAAPDDWAEICEPLSRPLYEATFAALAPLKGLAVLDAGCGTGLALRLAAAYGAKITGVDATAPMLDLARDRLPQADLRIGDLEQLPFADATFDVVTAFNSVQYAASPQAAVRELARVTKVGGRVAIGIWGDPAQCETEAVFQRVRALAPPPPGTHTPLALSTKGVLEDLLRKAGLVAAGSGDVSCPFVYPDLTTAWRGQRSVGPVRRAIEMVGEDLVRAAVVGALEPYRRPDGSYRQENMFRYLVAQRL
jgi:SAM-dependent methyltransferase